jgi:hypothetical protein
MSLWLRPQMRLARKARKTPENLRLKNRQKACYINGLIHRGGGVLGEPLSAGIFPVKGKVQGISADSVQKGDQALFSAP